MEIDLLQIELYTDVNQRCVIITCICACNEHIFLLLDQDQNNVDQDVLPGKGRKYHSDISGKFQTLLSHPIILKEMNIYLSLCVCNVIAFLVIFVRSKR